MEPFFCIAIFLYRICVLVEERLGFILDPLTKLKIPVAARSKAWVSGPSLAGIAGSNHSGYAGLL
jgi:hypothetical protein